MQILRNIMSYLNYNFETLLGIFGWMDYVFPIQPMLTFNDEILLCNPIAVFRLPVS